MKYSGTSQEISTNYGKVIKTYIFCFLCFIPQIDPQVVNCHVKVSYSINMISSVLPVTQRIIVFFDAFSVQRINCICVFECINDKQYRDTVHDWIFTGYKISYTHISLNLNMCYWKCSRNLSRNDCRSHPVYIHFISHSSRNIFLNYGTNGENGAPSSVYCI